MSSLLGNIANRQTGSLEACVAEYGGLVWRLAKRYLDNRPSEIEDAVQEVFLAIFISAARFDPEKGSEAAFIATLAHRRLIDFQRREVARYSAHERARKHAAPPPPRASKADLDAVAEEFDKLPDDERQAVWMAIHMGMTHQQISEATASPLGTVKSRLRRGYMRLAAAINPKKPAAAGTGGAS